MKRATTTWTRSSFCADNSCVEVALDGDRILLRDGKNVSQPALRFTRLEWEAFLGEVAAESKR